MNLKHLKSVSYGGGQTRISDVWKPVKLTQKNVRDRFDYVIDAGTMTGYQSCRSYYTAGTYGWNADVFIVGGINACVVAGYRAFGNIKAPRDLIKEYEDKAYEVNYNSKELDKLIDEFAYKVLAANGISDSRRVSDGISTRNIRGYHDKWTKDRMRSLETDGRSYQERDKEFANGYDKEEMALHILMEEELFYYWDDIRAENALKELQRYYPDATMEYLKQVYNDYGEAVDEAYN